MSSDAHADILQEATDCAAACAELVGDSPGFQQSFDQLLNVVRRLHAQFAFDPDGREMVVNSVRQALPRMERDMFEALVEDHACEVAALREALYRFALALRHR